jgi:hypothetical protein
VDRYYCRAIRAVFAWQYIQRLRSHPLLNLRGGRHPYPCQPDRRPIRLVPVGFEWEYQADAAKRRAYLLNDKMPTGLLVSPGMNHGGPFPATSHPAALHRAAQLRQRACSAPQLPAELRDENPNGTMWRKIDGERTRGDVPQAS